MPHQKVGPCLEQVVRVENPLIVSTQVGSNSLSRSKAHLQSNLAPLPFPADCVKAALLHHQLQRAETNNFWPQVTMHG